MRISLSKGLLTRIVSLAAFLGLQLICPVPVNSQDTTGIESSKLRLLFIGDIMGHDTQIASALDESTGIYDYSPVFRYISPILEAHDIVIANLEVTLAGQPYKGYPQFSSPAALATAARDAGIDILVTANNHSVDRGLDGINRTINRLDSLGIPHAGTYYDSVARDTLVPLILEVKGIRVALLNYTYGTNGIRVPAPAIVDQIDRGIMERDIKKSKDTGADAIVVFIHWGTEYDTLPSPDQTELADWLFDEGVMMVIGSHPHVIQPMELKREPSGDRIVAYSLGNFISNQRNRRTDGGAMLSVTLHKQESGVSIEETGYMLTWVYTPIESGKRRFYILPATGTDIGRLAGIAFDEDSKGIFKTFLDDSHRLMMRSNLNISEKLNK